MFEKVNPSHPDKIADRIAGALVDLCYGLEKSPKCAFEVLIGHGKCHIMGESSVDFSRMKKEVDGIVYRICGQEVETTLDIVPQDVHLAKNQEKCLKCGDNGIFKGTPVTAEQKRLTSLARGFYNAYNADGKYILNRNEVIVCQSNAKTEEIMKSMSGIDGLIVNPLGDWTGGIDVDSGAANRKLGSDMGDAVTGGGLFGKDLSKADVTLNIFCHIIAQSENCEVSSCCAIGDRDVRVWIANRGNPLMYRFEDLVEFANDYIEALGGFEKFAEWGLIR